VAGLTADDTTPGASTRRVKAKPRNVIVSEAKQYCHSGAMQSIEPGISRFRIWCSRTIPE
jgi:hypothetical protein